MLGRWPGRCFLSGVCGTSGDTLWHAKYFDHLSSRTIARVCCSGPAFTWGCNCSTCSSQCCRRASPRSPQIRCAPGGSRGWPTTGHFINMSSCLGRNEDDRGSVVILVGIDAGLLDDIPALSSTLMIALGDRASGEVVSFFFLPVPCID